MGFYKNVDKYAKVRGAETFVELNIHVDPGLTIEQAHEIAHNVENEIKTAIDRCEVHIHAEPEERSMRIQNHFS